MPPSGQGSRYGFQRGFWKPSRAPRSPKVASSFTLGTGEAAPLCSASASLCGGCPPEVPRSAAGTPQVRSLCLPVSGQAPESDIGLVIPCPVWLSCAPTPASGWYLRVPPLQPGGARPSFSPLSILPVFHSPSLRTLPRSGSVIIKCF